MSEAIFFDDLFALGAFLVEKSKIKLDLAICLVRFGVLEEEQKFVDS